MAPTTEAPERRVFHLLRKNGGQLDIPADTICDETGYGTSFRFKRGGEVVGKAAGDLLAWWVDPVDGAAAKTYVIEMTHGVYIHITADSIERVTEPIHKQVFKIGNDVVGAVYKDYHTWWIES